MQLAVIFDIDGTLVDSVDLHARAWKEALRDFGYDVAFDEVRGQVGKGADQLLPVFVPPEDLARRGRELTEHRARLFRERYLHEVAPLPGARDLLARVKADGQQVALASSAQSGELRTYKRLLGIDDLVDGDTSADDVEKSKPHGDIFEAALKTIAPVERDGAVVVGDTPYDAEAAARVGLRTVGVLSGGFPEASLREAGCIAIYDGPADLLARYDDSPLSARGRRTA